MTKTKSTKRALLLSALSLLMCVSMLVGSTFAWFTDSVTSAGNTIQSGTLDVNLVDANGNSMAGEVIEFVTADNRAQGAILWEPGCTYKTEPVRVVNEGNLALKYEIVINGINGDAKLLEAIEWTVTVGTTPTALADLKGELLAGETSEEIVLSGHMKEEAGNEYQGLTADGISIVVYATQLTHENDSFGNQYDAAANVVTVTPETVQAAINNADDNAVIQLAAGDYGVLTLAPVDGGKTTVLDSTTGKLSRSINGLTIKGVAGAKVDGIAVAVDGGNTISLNNIVIDGVAFTGAADGFVCTVNNVPLKNFTMKNCTMTSGAGFNLVKLRTPENVTITNCTVDGAARLLTTGASKNITITNNTINNVTEHGIHLSNSNGIHSGTIVVSKNTFNGNNTNARFIRFADVDDAKLIITDNEVRGYVPTAGDENDYIKITYKNNVEPDVTISGNKYEYQGTRLWISVKGDEYIQSTPDKL